MAAIVGPLRLHLPHPLLRRLPLPLPPPRPFLLPHPPPLARLLWVGTSKSPHRLPLSHQSSSDHGQLIPASSLLFFAAPSGFRRFLLGFNRGSSPFSPSKLTASPPSSSGHWPAKSWAMAAGAGSSASGSGDPPCSCLIASPMGQDSVFRPIGMGMVECRACRLVLIVPSSFHGFQS